MESQTQPLSFDYGPDEHHDPRLLQPGQASSAINVDWSREGAVQKRMGYTALTKNAIPAANPITNVGLLAGYGSSLIALDGSTTRLKSYPPAVAKWADIDDVPPCLGSQTPIGNFSTQIGSFDVAYVQLANGPVLVYVWSAADATGVSQIWTAVADANINAWLCQPTVVSSGAACLLPRVVSAGLTAGGVSPATSAVICYSQGVNLLACAIDLTSMTVGASTVMYTDFLNATGSYDICSVNPGGAAGSFGIVYNSSTANSVVVALRGCGSPFNVASTQTIAKPATALGQSFGCSICTGVLGTTTWVGYVYSTAGPIWSMYARGIANANYATTVQAESLVVSSVATGLPAGNACRASVCEISAAQVHCAMSPVYTNAADSGVNTTQFIAWVRFSSTGGVIDGASQSNHWGLGSKVFVQGGRFFGLTFYGGVLPSVSVNGATVTTRPTYELAELPIVTSAGGGALRPSATVAPRIAQQDLGTIPVMAQPVSYASGLWTTVGGVLRSSAVKFGVSRLDFDFRPSSARWQAAELGGVLYLGGGVPSAYDGSRVSEMGFLNPPPIYTLTTAGAGGAIAAGTYQYAVCFAWVDARGQICRSSPTFSSTIATIGATSQNTLTVAVDAMTNRQKPPSNVPQVFVELYRTTAGPGANFFKVFSDQVTAAQLSTVNGRILTLVEGLSDATLTGNAFGLLYTSGGNLDGQCPPSLMPFIAHGKRLVGAGDDGTTLWFTTEYDGGTTQPRFNDALTLAIPDGGKITGLASQDGNLYVFKADRIFVVSGSGPNEAGQGGGWDFQRLASDVGCSQIRGVVQSPTGIYFVGNGGRIFHVSRGQEVSFIGAPVEQTMLANPFVTSATLVPLKNQIRFTCQPTAAATTGVVVVYNYLLKKWATWQIWDNDQAMASASLATGALVSDVYYWGNTSGAVFQEVQSTTAANAFTDVGHWVTLTIESAWIKAAGVGGFGRFRYLAALGENVDPHDFYLSVASDYSDTYQQVGFFTAGDIATFSTPKELASIHIIQQKAAAVRFKISDAPPTGGPVVNTGAGPRLLGLNVLMGVYPSDYRAPPQQGV